MPVLGRFTRLRAVAALPREGFYVLGAANSEPWIRCEACGRTSYNPHDIEQHYCGHCHVFHDDLAAGPAPHPPDSPIQPPFETWDDDGSDAEGSDSSDGPDEDDD